MPDGHTPIPTLPYATPHTPAVGRHLSEFFRAFTNGMLLFCLIGTVVAVIMWGELAAFMLLVITGLSQTAALRGIAYIRLKPQRLCLTRRHLRSGFATGFLVNALTWLTYLALDWLLPRAFPFADRVKSLGLLIAIPLIYGVVSALVLTSWLKAAAE